MPKDLHTVHTENYNLQTNTIIMHAAATADSYTATPVAFFAAYCRQHSLPNSPLPTAALITFLNLTTSHLKHTKH